jgi:hypothetical protein
MFELQLVELHESNAVIASLRHQSAIYRLYVLSNVPHSTLRARVLAQ